MFYRQNPPSFTVFCDTANLLSIPLNSFFVSYTTSAMCQSVLSEKHYFCLQIYHFSMLFRIRSEKNRLFLLCSRPPTNGMVRNVHKIVCFEEAYAMTMVAAKRTLQVHSQNNRMHERVTDFCTLNSFHCRSLSLDCHVNFFLLYVKFSIFFPNPPNCSQKQSISEFTSVSISRRVNVMNISLRQESIILVFIHIGIKANYHNKHFAISECFRLGNWDVRLIGS